MSEAYSKELIAKALEIAKEKVSRYSKVYTSAHKVLLSNSGRIQDVPYSGS